MGITDILHCKIEYFMKHFILIILIFIVSNRISGQTPEYYIPTGGTTYTSSTASDHVWSKGFCAFVWYWSMFEV